MSGYKWHNPNPHWRNQYDTTIGVVRQTLGSYNKIATALVVHTGEHTTAQSIHRWGQEGNLPLKWATAMIDLLRIEGVDNITVFDFYPWLLDYASEDFLE